jgi:hypothetical protein
MFGMSREYSCAVHETFSSTPDRRRCRLLVQTQEPMTAHVYTVAHKVFLKTLRAKHVYPDEHATDASRLSYCPVRLSGTGYQFETTSGSPLDVSVVGRDVWHHLPSKVTEAGVSRPHAPHATATKQYVESAVASAQHNLQMAQEGSRHATLLKESLSLSRPELGLDLEDVERALFEVALERMGASRTHEIRAAIQSGFAKMRERSKY